MSRMPLQATRAYATPGITCGSSECAIVYEADDFYGFFTETIAPNTTYGPQIPPSVVANVNYGKWSNLGYAIDGGTGAKWVVTLPWTKAANQDQPVEVNFQTPGSTVLNTPPLAFPLEGIQESGAAVAYRSVAKFVNGRITIINEYALAYTSQ